MSILWRFVAHVGSVVRLIGASLAALREFRRVLPLLVHHFYEMGVASIPIVLGASTFTGMVAAIQTAYQIREYVPLIYLGSGVGKAVMIELGPVLTALVLAGRVGAGIAAEIGTMRVTEQIDALEIMGVSPVRYLVLPRLISGIITVPLLTVLAEFVALLGAAIITRIVLDLPFHTFASGVKMFFYGRDLWGGLAKSVVFGLIIALMGSYHGFYAEGGAVGVGRATTRAVVSSSVLILMADYVLGAWIFGG